MDPARWRKVEELYHQALERAPESRAVFVDEVCAGDHELRAEIESLLAADGPPAGPIDRPAWEGAESLVVAAMDSQLPAGAQLGPYNIVGVLGAGGMGDVYKALDTRLNRIVAIKISKEKFSRRFEQEARTVAALNHPHICTVHDVGPNYLVMEYLDGETLASRIAKGPLPLKLALDLATQIAGALTAAHEKGITHRDLKPSNIQLDKSGRVKVLDFGLAKTRTAIGGSEPTVITGLTTKGEIVGTLQYMAPEQLNDKETDSRADIFSFGCVLYEMLTGKRAFEGATTASVIAAILEREAPSVAGVAPTALERLMKKCLAKHPADRWQTARDLKDELEWIASGGSLQAGIAGPPRANWLGWAVAAVCALGLAALLFIHFRERPQEAPLTRFAIRPPEETTFQIPPGAGVASVEPALSPDGRKVVFRAVSLAANGRLWIRSLDALDVQPLAGTEEGYGPFWSPDGKSIGFAADGKLKRIDLAGGPVLSIADIGTGLGFSGSWSAEGTILFSPGKPGPLFSIPASGGTPIQATKLEGPQDFGHRFPRFLPGGKAFLFTKMQTNEIAGTLFAGSLGSMNTKALDEGNGTKTVYASGRLMFIRGGTLLARSFDPAGLNGSGDVVPIAEHVAGWNFDASANGTLIYATANALVGGRHLTWYDRQGKKLSVEGAAAIYTSPALSVDGKRLAVGVADPQTRMRDIWVFDLVRGVSTRLTFDPKDDVNPAWSPDGSRIAFSSDRKGLRNIFLKAASGASSEDLLRDSKSADSVEDWSPDGKYILYNAGARALWAVPLEGDRKPFPVADSAFVQADGKISPDSRWVAYRSNESGRNEIFIQNFPPAAGKWQISTSGGTGPFWRGDGKELYYLSGTKIMAVDIKTSAAGIEAGVAKELFDVPTLALGARRNDCTVMPDGKRFLCVTADEHPDAVPLVVVLNWPAALKK